MNMIIFGGIDTALPYLHMSMKSLPAHVYVLGICYNNNLMCLSGRNKVRVW